MQVTARHQTELYWSVEVLKLDRRMRKNWAIDIELHIKLGTLSFVLQSERLRSENGH